MERSYKTDSEFPTSEIISGLDNELNISYVGYKKPGILKSKYRILKDSSLVMNFIDFSLGDTEYDLTFNLESGSKLNLVFASMIDVGQYRKVHINVIHEQGRNESLISMYGLNKSKQDKLQFIPEATILNGSKGANTRVEGKIINLEPGANSSILPVLNIYENDVKAGHGAAVGSVSENQLYYLMSRGLTKQEAQKIITLGYFRPVIEKFSSINVKKALYKKLN